jgi:surface antigen
MFKSFQSSVVSTQSTPSKAKISLVGATLLVLADALVNTSSAHAGSIPIVEFKSGLYQIHRSVESVNPLAVGSSSNGNTWGNWQVDRFTATQSAPTITVFNNFLYQAHRGSDDAINIRFSKNGIDWSEWLKAPGAKTRYASIMATFNGRLYLAHIGSDNAIYTSSTADGANWNNWQRAEGTKTLNAPAMAAFNGRLYQSHRGGDDAIYTRSSSDGVNWTGWKREDGTATKMAPTMATFGNRLYQAHRGSNGDIFTRFSFDGNNWSAWQPTGVGTNTFSPAMMAPFAGRLYQTHQGHNGAVHIRSTSDGANWTNWQFTGGWTPTDAEDIGLPNVESLLKMSRDQQRESLGINPGSSYYSGQGNKFVSSNRTGGTYLWCTDYAYGRAMEKGLFVNNSGIGAKISGNAGWWDDNVGQTNNRTPKPDSFIVWDPGMGGAREAGHVGFVEAVYPDGSFLMSESNFGIPAMSFNLRHIKPGTAEYNSAKFVYLR